MNFSCFRVKVFNSKRKNISKTFYSFIVFGTSVLLQSLIFFVRGKLESLGFHSKWKRIIFEVRPEKWFFISFFLLKLSDLSGFFVFVCRIIISSITSALDIWLAVLAKTLLLYTTITSNINETNAKTSQ